MVKVFRVGLCYSLILRLVEIHRNDKAGILCSDATTRLGSAEVSLWIVRVSNYDARRERTFPA